MDIARFCYSHVPLRESHRYAKTLHSERASEICRACRKMDPSAADAHNANTKVEIAKNRCTALINRIQTLPSSKITDSCKRALIRLAESELRFLSRLALPSDSSASISINIGYLESVVHVLQQPFVSAISRVCKPIPLLQPGKKHDVHSECIHVDIVCTVHGNPCWLIVSDRNPKYIIWSDSHKNRGLRTRLEQVLAAAHSVHYLKPSLIILFFSRGLNEAVSWKLRDEFGASEFQAEFSFSDSSVFTEIEDWVYIIGRGRPSAFQLNVENTDKRDFIADHPIQNPDIGIGKPGLPEIQEFEAFHSLISTMRPNFAGLVCAKEEAPLDKNLVNFDTTALVALVSGISNSYTEQLLRATENEMRQRFKNNVDFVISQVMSELQKPILKDLRSMISGKRGIVCESVLSEFSELVSMYAGPNEKSRADQLLKRLQVVPDNPSERMRSLPTTRKIALKNKVIFGTGDYWGAPTLTANMGFVRAISQTGMSLSTIRHEPRALVGAEMPVLGGRQIAQNEEWCLQQRLSSCDWGKLHHVDSVAGNQGYGAPGGAQLHAE
ncbi:hypothetical protein ACLOJK_014299 [Asimina triloba]